MGRPPLACAALASSAAVFASAASRSACAAAAACACLASAAAASASRSRDGATKAPPAPPLLARMALRKDSGQQRFRGEGRRSQAEGEGTDVSVAANRSSTEPCVPPAGAATAEGR